MEAHNGKCISRYILHHKLRRADEVLKNMNKLQEGINNLIKKEDPQPTYEKATGAYRLAKNYYEMLKEQHEKVVEEGKKVKPKKILATTFMLPVVYTLPKNVAIPDQLTAILCLAAASENRITAYIVETEEVNFIIGNGDDIQMYIARYDIPTKIANYIPERIIYERRHLSLDLVPIPRPKKGKGSAAEITLKQMSDFQKRWEEAIRQINTIVNE